MSIKKVVLAVSFLLLLTSSFTVMAQTQVFAFPENGTDTITVDSDPYWWHVGDYAEGQRSLAQPAFSGTLNLVFPENGLNTNCSPGNWVDLEFYIDGALITTHRVVSGDNGATIPFELNSPATGSTTIRIEEINEVCGGGGSIIIDSAGASTIEFELIPVSVPTMSTGALILLTVLLALMGVGFGRRRFIA